MRRSLKAVEYVVLLAGTLILAWVVSALSGQLDKNAYDAIFRMYRPPDWQTQSIVLAIDEENPSISGDLKLVDVESGRTRELTITPRLLGEYRRALATHREALTRAAQAARGRFVQHFTQKRTVPVSTSVTMRNFSM